MPPLAATVAPARRVHGRLRVPGDKSISHRYALLAALADGPSRLQGYAPGHDCRSTLACLGRLGVEIVEDESGAVTLMGRGFGGLRSPAGPLDAGNSGTTLRLLAGILAGLPFASQLVGDASLSRRPMRRIIAPLERMGARIQATDGHAPLIIDGARLNGAAHRCEVPSAQVKSAVLLAGLHADGVTTVQEPAQTRDHTERAFEAFGVEIDCGPLSVAVRGGQPLRPCALHVPGDFSSAAFWMVAAAAFPGSEVEIDAVGLNPTRTALVGVLRRFGARVEVDVSSTDAGEPHGRVHVTGDRTLGLSIAPEEVPALIDELPALAALAASGAEIAVRGAAELRVKESDRIAALVAGMRALGLDADEFPDGFLIRGGGTTAASRVADACGDHRMAMAFAVAALAGATPATILGADSVAISYPGFFDTLHRLVT